MPCDVRTKRCVRHEGQLDAGGTAACTRGMIECQHQFVGHAVRRSGGKRRAIRLAHETPACARREPAPMLQWRRRRECRFGQDAVEFVGELGDETAVGDDRLDGAVGALRRYGDVLFVGGTSQLVLEGEGGRGRYAVGGQRRQMQADDAHTGRGQHGFTALRRGPRLRRTAAGLNDAFAVVEQRPCVRTAGGGSSVEQYA